MVSVVFTNSSDMQSIENTTETACCLTLHHFVVLPTNKNRSETNYGLNTTSVTLITDYPSSFLSFSNTKHRICFPFKLQPIPDLTALSLETITLTSICSTRSASTVHLLNFLTTFSPCPMTNSWRIFTKHLQRLSFSSFKSLVETLIYS